MKKNIILAAFFLICGFATGNSQEYDTQIVEGPEVIDAANEKAIIITGVSPNGRYCWGNNKTQTFYYDTETGDNAIIAITDEELAAGYKESNIAGITDDGIAIVCYGLRECYALNLNTGEKINIESPLEDYPYVHIWDMTPDGKILAGNCIDYVNRQHPAIAERQEDGTYKVIPIEFDEHDAMNEVAQFTQVRFITNNGKYLGGPQVIKTGFTSRYVVWERDEDGTYKFKTPFDDLLYDFTKENPGSQPNFYDYVTATDKKSEEYKQQKAEFDKAFKEYKAKFAEFTRNYTDVEWGGVYKSLYGEYLCGSIKQPTADYKYKFSPMYYNFETEEIVLLDTLEGNQKGWTILPENKYISLTGPSNVWFKVMLTDNGKTMPLHEWIQEKTGTDISDFYFGSFRDKLTWTTYEDVFVGFPFFSADGKTMISTTWLNNEYLTSIIRFSNNIFGNVQTEIKGELVSTFNVQGSVIKSSSAIVDIYTFDGKKVNTFNVSGSIDLTEKLARGNYIVKVKEGNSAKNFKLIIG